MLVEVDAGEITTASEPSFSRFAADATSFTFDEHHGPIEAIGWTGRSFQTSNASSLPRTVNGTGHTGPSEFCATSI